MVAAGKGLILLYAVLLIAVIVDGAISARSNSDPSIVITDTGAVRGQIGDGFRAFKGLCTCVCVFVYLLINPIKKKTGDR